MNGAKPGSPEAPISDGDPQCGRFKMRQDRNGPWLPVAIYLQQEFDPETGELTGDEKLVATVGGKGHAANRDANEIWLWCSKHPVSESSYRVAYLTGKWPEEPTLGANTEPGDSFETLTDQLSTAIDMAGELPEKIETQEQADLAANLKDRINAYAKALDEMRDAEKRPHDEASKAVQAKFRPFLDRSMDVLDGIRHKLTSYLRTIRERAEQAAREKAKAAGGSGAEAALAAPKARAGGHYGKKTGLRTVTRIKITDYNAALEAVKADDAMTALVHKICERRARAGVETPGVEIIKEQVAQ